MNATERVRKRIQETAIELARRKSLPSARHAEAIVMHIMREEGMDAPSHDTIVSLRRLLRCATDKD